MSSPTSPFVIDTDEVKNGDVLVGGCARSGHELLGELVDGVAQLERMLARVTAWRAELIEKTRVWCEANTGALVSVDDRNTPQQRQEFARRALVAELGTVLHLPEAQVERLLEESRTLVGELPGTLESLREGRISHRHASTIVDQAWSLGEGASDGNEDDPVTDPAAVSAARAEVLADFEEAVLPFAESLTPPKFDRKARTLRERMHPETIMARRVRAAKDREVRFTPARDGMAWLSLYLEAPVAVAAHHRVTGDAMSLQGPDEPRTLTQLRADVAADLLLNDTAASIAITQDDDAENSPGLDPEARADESRTAPGRRPRIRPTVMVTVPALTLLGMDDEPAILDGYGPIDAETARELCAQAPSFTRILTHPETGAILSVGRDSYRVPADLKRLLRVRDGTCRFPGCTRAAAHSDLDHTLDWQYGGATALGNLAHLCPKHHALKHRTRWSVEQARDGTLTWTSPSAHQHTTEPELDVRGATVQAAVDAPAVDPPF